MTEADRKLIASIPEALSTTDIVCASVNVGSTKAGIDMDAVALMGRTIKELAQRTADKGGFAAPSWWCSATRWRTTPSWPAPSTACRSRTG